MCVCRAIVFDIERTNINLPGYLVEFNVVQSQLPFLTSEHYIMKIPKSKLSFVDPP